MLKNLELEWKILLLACLLLVAFAWPVQRYYISRLKATLEQSVDPGHEDLMRSYLPEARGEAREEIVASLERNRQWQALIPIIVKEQQRAILAFSAAVFLALIAVSLWTLKRLTQPLKNLARAVEGIGKGEVVAVPTDSGGALGRLESTVSSLQEELRVLREKARVQGMEAAWKEIARVMAHEIKNPLTPIRLTLDRMEERLAEGSKLDAAQTRKFLGRINVQVDTLEMLVNQFRSFSRDPEVNLTSVDARKAVEHTAADMAGGLQRSIEGAARITADPRLLNQVLLNLWKNALDAGANSIVVSISAATEPATIDITDNGPGIPPEKLERVWLPYVSFTRGGTGLGLPVVKKLAETMGGSVELISRTEGPDHGLTVRLRFPGHCPRPSTESRP